MTNMEYIMGRMTERDIAELFASRYRFKFQGNFTSKVDKAFENWRKDTYRPNRNFTVEGEPDPSVWQWLKIHNHKTNEWENKGRTEIVAFQQWLGLQFNEKHWN